MDANKKPMEDLGVRKPLLSCGIKRANNENLVIRTFSFGDDYKIVILKKKVKNGGR